MADKTIWILKGDGAWAVQIDGYWLVTGLSYEAAVLKAGKLASFIEEDGKSAECKLLRQNGASHTLKRPSPLSSRVRVWRGGHGSLRRRGEAGPAASPPHL